MNTQHQATLYTRAGCHLCDDARIVLERYGITVTAIDIDSDEKLNSQYTNCVPVVWIDGRERFRGHIDERLLLRLLRAGKPS